MRRYVERGSISTRKQYEYLRKDVWDEFYKLYTDGNVLHDNDIQSIAMVKAKERGLHDFKVNITKHTFLKISSQYHLINLLPLVYFKGKRWLDLLF